MTGEFEGRPIYFGYLGSAYVKSEIFMLTRTVHMIIIQSTIPARPLNDAQIGGLLFLWGPHGPEQTP